MESRGASAVRLRLGPVTNPKAQGRLHVNSRARTVAASMAPKDTVEEWERGGFSFGAQKCFVSLCEEKNLSLPSPPVQTTSDET